ncbi:MAG: DUF4080 domain-containing protein [Ruminococcaceae bacterium]|nr:DUF4080 domain-containing protein [Oscillospiraceae bacterium]
MKVIIACLNSKFVHSSLAPWCLFSGVKAYSKEHDTKVMECTINSNIIDFAESILSENPEILSFSCYIWNIEKTLEVCKYLKSKSDVTIILGGPEVSYRAKNVLENYRFVDFVLSGEGEETYPQLLDILSQKGDLSTVSGLSYRKTGEIISNSEKVYTGTPVSPYSDEYFNNLNGKITYIETSRGCPYRCAFCLSGNTSPLRFFDLEKVKEDIIKVSNSGTQTVKFIDRTFNANAKRANEIIKFIIDNRGIKIPENVCFHFEIAGDILKEETFEILEKAPKGLFQLEIGMQSFNDETLNAINRKTDTKKLIENIKRLISFQNMHIHIDLIAGLTGEDLKSFERSFDIGYSLGANMLQMGFLKLLYGADMRKYPEKYPCKYTENPPYEVTETPWLSSEEIIKLKKCEDALERLYNSGRFLFTLDYLIGSKIFTPFQLFCKFGNEIDGNKMNLSDYAVHIYHFFKDYADEEILRETILCDLLSCSSALQIPEIFKVNDPLYKKLKKQFANIKGEHNKIAILYKTNRVFVVNQNSEKDFFGRFSGKYYSLDEFKNTGN